MTGHSQHIKFKSVKATTSWSKTDTQSTYLHNLRAQGNSFAHPPPHPEIRTQRTISMTEHRDGLKYLIKTSK